MKKIIILLFISIQLVSQNDSVIHLSITDNVKHRKIENIDYKMIGIIGAVTAPAIVLYSMDAKNDKLGQVAFGSLSAISITALSTSLVVYLKSNDSKKPLIHYSCMAVAGALDGFSEELRFHYPKVKAKMPFLNDNFWNPDVSFYRKYKNGDPKQGAAFFGSTTIFVGATDGFHLTRFLNKGFVMGGIITFDYSKSFKKNCKKVLLTAFVYTMAKGTTHFIINN